LISAQNVTRRFGALLAVNNASFAVSPGVCALLGPNGSGKSTLLKMLSGLLAASSGVLRVAEFDAAEASVAMKRAIGVLPDDLGLFAGLTIREHFELCGRIYGLSGAERQKRTRDLLDALALAPATDTLLKECSHGTRKKTSLALAVLHVPRVLLLDEPFEGVDPSASQVIAAILQAFAERGATVLFSSHSLAHVQRIATQVLIMRAGEIVFDSSVSSMRHNESPLDALYSEFRPAQRFQEPEWMKPSPS
jgi:ABC-2 type transport system ATP-binding protein